MKLYASGHSGRLVMLSSGAVVAIAIRSAKSPGAPLL